MVIMEVESFYNNIFVNLSNYSKLFDWNIRRFHCHHLFPLDNRMCGNWIWCGLRKVQTRNVTNFSNFHAWNIEYSIFLVLFFRMVIISLCLVLNINHFLLYRTKTHTHTQCIQMWSFGSQSQHMCSCSYVCSAVRDKGIRDIRETIQFINIGDGTHRVIHLKCHLS